MPPLITTFLTFNLNFMKRIVLLFGLILFVGSIFAQEGQAPLAKGDKQLNFGLGFSGHGLPVYAGMDFAVHDDITVGPEVNVNFGNDGNVSFSAIGRGDYHFNRIIGIPSNWDFYAGANLGFRVGEEFKMRFGIQVGGRWYWSEKWGLNLEFGGGSTFGTHAGLSMKF